MVRERGHNGIVPANLYCSPVNINGLSMTFSLLTFAPGSAYYFELTIVSTGDDAVEGPVIGLTSALHNDNRLPGQTSETIGFSAANRTVYQNPKKGRCAI